MPPDLIEIDALTCCRFVLGGIFWLFIGSVGDCIRPELLVQAAGGRPVVGRGELEPNMMGQFVWMGRWHRWIRVTVRAESDAA